MMKKPEPSKDAVDKLVKNIRSKARQTYSAEEKIALSWPVCAARKASRCYAGAKVLRKAYITVGRRNFWRRASDGCRAIQRVKRRRRK